MAYDLGIYASFLAETETVYGTAPANFKKLAFVPTHGLSKQQNLLPSDVLGEGRDPTDPLLGAINVTGPVAVPLCLNQSGFWLKHIFGLPTTSGTTPDYEHVFKSGALTLPSLSAHVWSPNLGRGRTAKGVRVNDFSLEMGREVLPALRMNLIGQDEANTVAIADSTPDETLALARFHPFKGQIKKDGAALADIVSATMTYRNNLDIVAPIRADGLIADALPAQAAFEASLRARVKDGSLLDIAGTDTTIELEFGYVNSATASLLFTAHRVWLPKPTQEISGPGGIEVTFNNLGAKDSTAGNMLTATLKNAVASYA